MTGNNKLEEYVRDVLISLCQIDERECSIETWDIISDAIETLDDALRGSDNVQ